MNLPEHVVDAALAAVRARHDDEQEFRRDVAEDRDVMRLDTVAALEAAAPLLCPVSDPGAVSGGHDPAPPAQPSRWRSGRRRLMSTAKPMSPNKRVFSYVAQPGGAMSPKQRRRRLHKLGRLAALERRNPGQKPADLTADGDA